MKGLIISAITVFSILFLNNNAFSQSSFALKGGIDTMGETDMEYADKGDADMGFGIGGELTVPYSERFVLGGGAVYQLPRGIDEEGWEDWEFNFLPIYGLAKIIIPADNLNIFLAVNIGYGIGFLDAPGDIEMDGGLYYGFGGGIEFGNGFFIELLYTVNEGTLSSDDFDIEADAEYSKVSIFVGMKF